MYGRHPTQRFNTISIVSDIRRPKVKIKMWIFRHDDVSFVLHLIFTDIHILAIFTNGTPHNLLFTSL